MGGGGGEPEARGRVTVLGLRHGNEYPKKLL